MPLTNLKLRIAMLAVGAGVTCFGQTGGPPETKPPEGLASVARKMADIRDRLKDGFGGERTQKLLRKML